MSNRDLQQIGQRKYNAILKLVENLRLAEDEENEEAREAAYQAIIEDPLSVQVRGGWHSPGASDTGPEEYEILLSTGGPATRIIGKLNEYCEPSSAQLQAQDWFTEWETFRGADEDVLLEYAQQFYFGD